MLGVMMSGELNAYQAVVTKVSRCFASSLAPFGGRQLFRSADGFRSLTGAFARTPGSRSYFLFCAKY